MQQPRTRPTILLLEDYQDSRQMLKLLLEEIGYRVLPAAEGKEALAAARTNQIDLVLTDFNLPDMTGPTVVRYLRKLGDGLAQVPIIMLTAIDVLEHRALAAEAGCDAFLIKPPDFEVLVATIDRLLTVSRRRKDSRGDEEDGEPTSSTELFARQ